MIGPGTVTVTPDVADWDLTLLISGRVYRVRELDLADAAEKLPEGGHRTAAASDVMSRSGREMVGVLSQGSHAIREQMRRHEAYGAVVTRTSAKSAGAWNDAVGEMKLAWHGFQNLIAEPLRDSLLPYLDKLLAWVRQHPGEMRRIAREVAETVVEGFKAIIGISKALLPVLKLVADNLGPIGFAAAALLAAKAAYALVAGLQAAVVAYAAAGAAATAASVKFAAAGAASRASIAAGAGGAVGAGTYGDIGGTVGGMGGWWGGAKLGAAAGAIAGPKGAAVGAVVGGIAGALGGGYVGSKIENLIVNVDPKTEADEIARQLAPQLQSHREQQRRIINENIHAKILLGL